MSFILSVIFICVVGRVTGFAIRAAWKVSAVLFSVIFLPLTLICMIVAGLIRIAFPVLVIAGILYLVRRNRIL